MQLITYFSENKIIINVGTYTKYINLIYYKNIDILLYLYIYIFPLHFYYRYYNRMKEEDIY